MKVLVLSPVCRTRNASPSLLIQHRTAFSTVSATTLPDPPLTPHRDPPTGQELTQVFMTTRRKDSCRWRSSDASVGYLLLLRVLSVHSSPLKGLKLFFPGLFVILMLISLRSDRWAVESGDRLHQSLIYPHLSFLVPWQKNVEWMKGWDIREGYFQRPKESDGNPVWMT